MVDFIGLVESHAIAASSSCDEFICVIISTHGNVVAIVPAGACISERVGYCIVIDALEESIVPLFISFSKISTLVHFFQLGVATDEFTIDKDGRDHAVSNSILNEVNSSRCVVEVIKIDYIRRVS